MYYMHLHICTLIASYVCIQCQYKCTCTYVYKIHTIDAQLLNCLQQLIFFTIEIGNQRIRSTLYTDWAGL